MWTLDMRGAEANLVPVLSACMSLTASLKRPPVLFPTISR